MVDFLNNPIAEFNELRIATTNLVTTKAAEYSETVLTFVSNHSSELLYGSLSVFAVVTIVYLLDKGLEAACERDSYKCNFERAKRWANFWRKSYEEELEKVFDLEESLSDFHDERRKMQDVINKLREECDAFEADLEEVRNDRDSFVSNAEYWEEQCIDVRNERDELESERDNIEAERDNIEAERDNIEAERDVLLERIELLQEMTDTYKELVAEIETPQLRLAA